MFESNVLMVCRTNKLRSEAAPAVFDFCYSVMCTEGPGPTLSNSIHCWTGRKREKLSQ